mgnify:CR=1 FL=1
MELENTYSPVGRKGNYSFETVDIGGTRFTWKPNQNRWEISGGAAYEALSGNFGTANPNVREKLPSGEFVGGAYNAPVGVTIPKTIQGDDIPFTNYSYIIKTNVKGVTTYVNDVVTTSSTLNYTPSDIQKTGDIRIRVQKDGYSNNVEYIISNQNVSGIDTFNEVRINNGDSYQQRLGANLRRLVVKKYVNGQIVNYTGTNGNLSVLDFELIKNKIETTPTPPTPILNTLIVNISGTNGSVVATKNGIVNVKIVKGKNVYTDVSTTKFDIRPSSSYLIKSITQTEPGKKPTTITARPQQSLTFNTVFDKANLVVDIEVERVLVRPPSPPPPPPDIFTPPTPPPPKITPTPLGPEPKIQLLDSSTRTHNINSNTGIPIAFKKNDAVKSVTVFVGTESFEFNNLGNGEVVGIVIPHKAFANIGRYDIKIIPYSLDELDDTITEIRTGKTTRTVERVTTVPVPRPVPIITNIISDPKPPVVPPPIPRPDLVPDIIPIKRLLPEENFLQSIERGLNTTRTPNIFTDQRDINVRGIGFDDEVRMENINGVAQIANTQTNARILNPGAFLVNGTGDLSIPAGRLPGSRVVPIEDPSINTPIETGRGNYTANEQLAARARLLNQQAGGGSTRDIKPESNTNTNRRQL